MWIKKIRTSDEDGDFFIWSKARNGKELDEGREFFFPKESVG